MENIREQKIYSFISLLQEEKRIDTPISRQFPKSIP